MRRLLIVIGFLILGGCDWSDNPSGAQIDIHCFGATPANGDTSSRVRCPDSIVEQNRRH